MPDLRPSFRRAAALFGSALFLASLPLVAQPAGSASRPHASLTQALPAAGPASGDSYRALLSPAFQPQTDPATLSGESLFKAALDFSLCPPSSDAYAGSLSAYRALEATVTAPAFLALAEEERAEQILLLLYEATLRRYNFDQSRMDLLFADGVYNCVSSSVLYAALATAAGILVTGNLTRDHAFCTVYIGGRKIDVETTNPNGFNPGTRKPVESHGGGTAYYVVPKKSYAGRKEVSLAMLVSAVGKNLMAGFDKKNDYERALPLALARFPYGLSPAEEQELRSDFDVVAGNYANLLNRADRCQEAVLFLEAVYARYGQTAYLGENYDVSAHNAVGALVNSGRFQEAAGFLSAHGAFISPETYRELDQALFLTAADSQVQQLAAADPDAALSLLRELRSDRRAGAAAAKKRLDELCEYSWYQKARLPFDAKDFLAAAALCDQGLQEVPQSRSLQTMRKQALQNHAVGYHNRFAQLANAGQYEEALAVLQQGLSENPGNATLQGDLKQLRRIMGR